MPEATPREIEAFLAEAFPQIADLNLRVEQAGGRKARVRMPIGEDNLRPGGTVSGPTLFWLADLGLYIAVLADLGTEAAAMAVTANATVNFLSKPERADLIADVRLMKLGRRLAVGEVAIYSEGKDDMVAHITGSYALPPAKTG
ncbi:MAG: hypothetical protein TEF_20990 [Rhizobiales bacterium NRL2]|nr:MAG: hypothetical protein TEF_20990 [Rhizobiales bacterium NRL2]